MACRLPGGIHSPNQLWDFLLAKGDARTRVPGTRYNISAYHSATKKPGTTVADYGYFLDETVDLGALDPSFFSIPRAEMERLDPQQRLLLEVSREALDDAGEVGWRGSNIGVYVGNYGQDYYDLFNRETQMYGYQVTATNDFMVSNRLSYEMDLHGPSMTIRTGCSAALIGLNEACMAISRGDCKSAIIGGANILLAPALTMAISGQGVLSADGSCKTFSTNANGYGRGEAVVAFFVKPLSDAIRDGNPVRAVIVGTATNCDGKTPGISVPSATAQEALIRRTYEVAGISDFSKTAFVECHGTGTNVGDPIETSAVSRVFGGSGIHIGSIKPNLGHSEGSSGLTSLLKAVLALEHRTIPPNIKSHPLNPNIPFQEAKLTVPVEATPWPESKYERISINSFGIGGANAHVILDSAASFNTSRLIGTKTELEVSDDPQLLVYSANTAESLDQMMEKYQEYLDKTQEDLADIAYTLANRREHLPYRSFAVTARDQPSIASPSSASGKSGQPPTLVMVFTGQGAQWPQMGRELLRSNPVFLNTIRSLDQYLQSLGPSAPSWKIEEELLKAAKTSRVAEAEFSQPLCTALQIALVDALAFVGIQPAMVVGHSSGEIVAAYAAGGLTAQEAIAIAFHRGQVSKQARLGAMAAVGFSWEDAQEYLTPGVIIACDNSPSNVTLSGDADEVRNVVAAIKESVPGVLATMLKVEKAYHSDHMVDVSEEYYKAMVSSKVIGRKPSKAFFSSVTGGLFDGTEAGQFGPQYWQRNLESPVLFKSAVTSILQHEAAVNPVFLEIGPHPALAGPVRQILTRESSKAPYVASLSRRQNATEGFLSAVGKLFTLHIDVDFKALIPHGSCVPDLPRYPWNHQRSHWFESRVSKEWRLRKHAYHDLLGVKVTESTDLEPIWRNVFHLSNAPWVRDHKIHDDIVFPFAGYVAMAAEAIRQITGVQDGVSLRKVVVTTALVVNEGAPTEFITSLRPHRLTDSLDSQWWEFTISSHNGHMWTKHTTGEVRAVAAETEEIAQVDALPELPRKVSEQKWYETIRRGGLDYGPHFTSLENVRTSTKSQRLATAETRNNWHGDEANYHLHPVILDSYFQLLGFAVRYGLTHDYRQVIPTVVESVTIFRSSVDRFTLFASADVLGEDTIGSGSVAADSRTVLRISGVALTPLNDAGDDEQLNIPITARSEWVRHIDFAESHTLIKSPWDHHLYNLALKELTQLAITLFQRSVVGGEALIQVPHLKKYKEWLDQQSIQYLEKFDSTTLTKRVDSLVKILAESPASHAATAIRKVSTHAAAILSGETDAFEVLSTDDTLNKLYSFTKDSDTSEFLQCLALGKPNLRVLELGAGSGMATTAILKHLTRTDGQALYSQYVVSDVSSGIINSIKNEQHFKGIPNLEFATFDIGKDPADQGFEDREFDLIVASGVIHTTPRIQESLINARKLLSPNGRLLLQEPRGGLTWYKFVFGTLPGWWCGGDDGRPDEPFISTRRWKQELIAAGFEGLDGLDLELSEQSDTIVAVKPQRETTATKRVTLLYNTETSALNPLIHELESKGYEIVFCTIEDTPPHGQDVIALLDRDGPFFDNIDSPSFENFKKFVASLDGSGILWITRLSQIECPDPRYALVNGLSRTMRSELAIDFATCETDDFDSATGVRAIANVFDRFWDRHDDGVLGSDFEYAITEGVTRVNRFFPFSLKEELLVSDTSDEAYLTIGRPGRLDSLHWSGEPAKLPQKDEVEVEVQAVGLNFRDVLVAMGIIELPQLMFGYEATGIVRCVGPQVKKFRVGDRVAVVAVKTFSTVITVSELLCEVLPDNLSFVDGASMPLIFTTSIYSLIDIGHLEKGQSVLIHSGCGGVGLAAIQIARMIGAEIYTTVSNEEKVKYLMDTFGLPKNRIFDSRSESFVKDVMRETGGRGVDLALNSLSGELLHATWHCIAKWGMMVEIGKRDLLGAGKLDMEVFLANRSYSCVDMDQMRSERPHMVDRLLSTMMDFFREGHIQPVRLAKVSSAPALQDTFRYMQQGSHIGKIVIELRDSDGRAQLGKVETVREKLVQLDSSASYLLIGGLGGLGRSISIWMVQHGARNLTFLSRNAGLGKHDKDFVCELESMNCTVQLVHGSVTDVEDVALAVDGVAAPLKGIIQMSMVLRDQGFPRMSIDEWNGVTQPKVQGTWNLHNVTQARNLDLDFFILFSSLSGILGQPGQANYAAANTFLDAFVHYRKSLQLPCTAIDIGAMEGAGYLSENVDLLKKMKGTGWRAVQEGELLEAVGAAILHKEAQLASEQSTSGLVNRNNFLLGISPTVPLSNPGSSARVRRDIRMAVYHNVSSGSSSSGSNDGLHSFLATAKNNPTILRSPETAPLIAREIGKQLFSLLLKADEQVNISLSLAELGMDSMTAVEMRGWWKLTFGFEISVLEMLGMGTLAALGERATEGLIALHDA
ncbi:hypothetical protein F5884DRAFT_846143 [Xylogone sp. PMI_703]|nr:hypothetical protein F5884DRAFT_846143 [Xylogone sp. PMI_703]